MSGMVHCIPGIDNANSLAIDSIGLLTAYSSTLPTALPTGATISSMTQLKTSTAAPAIHSTTSVTTSTTASTKYSTGPPNL